MQPSLLMIFPASVSGGRNSFERRLAIPVEAHGSRQPGPQARLMAVNGSLEGMGSLKLSRAAGQARARCFEPHQDTRIADHLAVILKQWL